MGESASQLLVTGKRNLVVSEVPSAVSVLAQACEMLSSKFGETAIECAEAYFYYGKSLLELSRMESGVLGNALDGVPEEDDGANDSKIEDPGKVTEDEKEKITDQVVEALDENKAQIEERLCSTIISLGEVSIENENYAQAVEDLKACLSKQDSLPKDSRIVAETHYQLGVAQGYNNQ